MDHCRDMFYGKVVDYIKAAATLSDKCSKPFRVYVFVADPVYYYYYCCYYYYYY